MVARASAARPPLRVRGMQLLLATQRLVVNKTHAAAAAQREHTLGKCVLSLVLPTRSQRGYNVKSNNNRNR